MKNTGARRRQVRVAECAADAPVVMHHLGPSSKPDRRIWLVAIPLVVLVAVAFSPILDGRFVDWDDAANFLQNARYRGLGRAQIRWAWSTFLLGVYQPVGWMILEAQYVVWRLAPRGYHLTSLLLHAANAVVLYALTVALLSRCPSDRSPRGAWARAVGAGLATALFALHPLRVEPVAWASCQTYLPCALFAMLAVLTYLRAVGDGGRRHPGWLAASLLLFAAALLSKAPAVSLPAVLLILDVYPLRRLGGGPGRWFGAEARRVWLEKIPFVAMSLVFMGVAVAAKAGAGTITPVERDGILGRIALACYAAWSYIVKTTIPSEIAPLYPVPGRIDWWAPAFLASILATLAMTAGLFLARRRWPGLLAAWLGYLVLLAPASGLVRIGDQLASDRYCYLPMMALVIPAAAGLGLVWGCSRRDIGVAICALAGVAALGLIPLSRAQCRVWLSSEALWSYALEHGGRSSAIAHHGMGTVRLSQGRTDEAFAHYEEALRCDPRFARAHAGLGSISSLRGRFGEALAHFEEAIRLDPHLVDALNNRAMILAACPDARHRDGAKAVESASLAGALSGWDDPMILDTLAAAHAEAGDFDAAAGWEERAIALLTDEGLREDFRSRLALYRAKKPYREASFQPLGRGDL